MLMSSMTPAFQSDTKILIILLSNLFYQLWNEAQTEREHKQLLHILVMIKDDLNDLNQHKSDWVAA